MCKQSAEDVAGSLGMSVGCCAVIALALNAFFRTGLDWRRFTAADLELLRDASPGDCEEIFARQEIEAKGVLPE